MNRINITAIEKHWMSYKGRKGIIKGEFGAGLRDETPMDAAI